MQRLVRNFIASLVQKAGYTIIKSARMTDLQADSRASQILRVLQALPEDIGARSLQLVARMKSQYGQDLVALAASNFAHEGYFVEFGATDGVSLSNTWLLENDFGWKGILAEPARGWHSSLRMNRNCIIDERCVWHRSGEQLTFRETPVGELSTVASYTRGDALAEARVTGRDYEVESISLNDLLDVAKAPQFIDFLSIDTEGTELLILQNLDFERYRFRMISVEHNHRPQRHDIHRLLSANGYTRIMEDLSQCDDWYVSPAHSAI
jgi:FkbM family methyltransferase